MPWVTVELSIPSWSDFNPCVVTFFASNPYSFQSHLGLISTSKALILELKRVWYFQSHLGLISTEVKIDALCEVKVFQSHLGLISTSFKWMIVYIVER